jgi:erythromycin esterase
MKKLIIITLLLGKTVFGFTQQNQLENLIKIMSNKNIVALGEGTHGTKEFNDVRIEIIKQLITQYGFRKICWENAYGNTYRLNQVILSNSDVKKALEQHMSAIWQTKEILDFLVWLQNYNLTTDEKVQLVGLDWNYLEESAKIVKEHFTSSSIARELYFCTKSQDNSWKHKMILRSNLI